MIITLIVLSSTRWTYWQQPDLMINVNMKMLWYVFVKLSICNNVDKTELYVCADILRESGFPRQWSTGTDNASNEELRRRCFRCPEGDAGRFCCEFFSVVHCFQELCRNNLFFYKENVFNTQGFVYNNTPLKIYTLRNLCWTKDIIFH